MLSTLRPSCELLVNPDQLFTTENIIFDVTFTKYFGSQNRNVFQFASNSCPAASSLSHTVWHGVLFKTAASVVTDGAP